MRKILIIILIIVVVGVVFVFAKNKKENNFDDKKISVVASFYPIKFFVEEIGKEKLHVTNLTPAGIDPHEFEPTASDLILISKSNLVVLNGVGLEPWASGAIDHIKKDTTKIVFVGDEVANRRAEEDGVDIRDPHVWLSPMIAKKISNKIADYLIDIDGNESFYTTNKKILSDKFDELDKEFRSGLSTCDTKKFIVAHDAFGYLADEYNLQPIPIAGISHEDEPSPQKLASIAKLAKENNIKHVFFETLASPKLTETLASEIGAQALVLDPLEGLTPQAQEQGEDYFTVMRNNLKNLQTALGCK